MGLELIPLTIKSLHDAHISHFTCVYTVHKFQVRLCVFECTLLLNIYQQHLLRKSVSISCVYTFGLLYLMSEILLHVWVCLIILFTL